MILSGINEMDSKVRALGFGADDYITKPFHREELIARIQAVVRRSRGHSQSVIRYCPELPQDCQVDPDANADGTRLRRRARLDPL